MTKILGTTRVKVQFFREHIIITKCYKRKYTWYMWTSTKKENPGTNEKLACEEKSYLKLVKSECIKEER